jgi:hypothetical protein
MRIRASDAAGNRRVATAAFACAALVALQSEVSSGPTWARAPLKLSVAAACEIPNLSSGSARLAGVGGLSGIAREGEAESWLAVSDSQAGPRWYRLSLVVDGVHCTARASEPVHLAVPPDWSTVPYDAEGITVLPGGRVLISTEGDAYRWPRIAPGVFEFTAGGEAVAAWTLPDRLTQRVERPARGVRSNAALESLSATLDGARVFAATEQPLLQDGPAPTFGRGGLARLLEFAREGGQYRVSREFALPLEAMTHPGDLRPTAADSGAVALLALDDRTLLLLERAFVQGRRDGERAAYNDIILSRLFLDDADDVSGVESLEDSLSRPVRKEVLSRLSDLASDLPDWLRALDNFEGLAFGPRLADGKPSLVMVSDDNFSPRQHSAFLVLRVDAR